MNYLSLSFSILYKEEIEYLAALLDVCQGAYIVSPAWPSYKTKIAKDKCFSYHDYV